MLWIHCRKLSDRILWISLFGILVFFLLQSNCFSSDAVDFLYGVNVWIQAFVHFHFVRWAGLDSNGVLKRLAIRVSEGAGCVLHDVDWLASSTRNVRGVRFTYLRNRFIYSNLDVFRTIMLSVFLQIQLLSVLVKRLHPNLLAYCPVTDIFLWWICFLNFNCRHDFRRLR